MWIQEFLGRADLEVVAARSCATGGEGDLLHMVVDHLIWMSNIAKATTTWVLARLVMYPYLYRKKKKIPSLEEKGIHFDWISGKRCAFFFKF
jgi:hypothetical protein